METAKELSSANNEEARINVRVKKTVKEEVERIFNVLGLNLTEGINIYLHRVIIENGIPFDLRVPRSEIIGSKAAAMETVAINAVKNAIATNEAKGIPPVRYDVISKKIYTEE